MSLAQEREADAFIVPPDTGYALLPLHASDSQFFADDLEVSRQEILDWAKWNQEENPRVTLVALETRRQGSLLRGVILAACETSKCYKRFAWPYQGRPYRDFFYNVTYESIAHASRWGVRRLATSHLGGARFPDEIVQCQVEALVHFCDEATTPVVDRFIFAGCFVTLQHFQGIERFIEEARKTRHRPITVEIETRNRVKLLHLSWRLQGRKGIAVNEEFNRTEYGFCECIEQWFAHEMGYTRCRWEVDPNECVAKLILQRQANAPLADADFKSKCKDILLRAAIPLGDRGVLLNVAGDDVEVSFRFPKDMAQVFSAPRREFTAAEGELREFLDRAGVFMNRKKYGFCEYIER